MMGLEDDKDDAVPPRSDALPSRMRHGGDNVETPLEHFSVLLYSD